MDKLQKLAVIKRSLGIRHKLKVHESMKAPETHEDLAIMLISKWELEDELHAIEQLFAEGRQKNVELKKATLLKAQDDAMEIQARVEAGLIEDTSGDSPANSKKNPKK